MKNKILFLDLDGTLLNDRKEITTGNRQAMDHALSLGHRIVIASGRPLKSALLQAERLGLNGKGCYVIAYNGAVIYDCAEKRCVFSMTLQWDDLFEVFDEANRRGIYIQTYDGDDVVLERRNAEHMAVRYCAPIQMTYHVIEDVRKDLTEPPCKALLIDFRDRTYTEPMRQWITEHMRGRVDTFFSSAYYLEVVPAGMNKGRAVMDLCGVLGIPVSEAVAAGDEANDISMISAAGTGVAVQNAVPEVKAVAAYITQRDNNHDAVAEIIEKFLL